MVKTETVRDFLSRIGKVGGHARAKKLSKSRRVEIAKLARAARERKRQEAR